MVGRGVSGARHAEPMARTSQSVATRPPSILIQHGALLHRNPADAVNASTLADLDKARSIADSRPAPGDLLGVGISRRQLREGRPTDETPTDCHTKAYPFTRNRAQLHTAIRARGSDQVRDWRPQTFLLQATGGARADESLQGGSLRVRHTRREAAQRSHPQ